MNSFLSENTILFTEKIYCSYRVLTGIWKEDFRKHHTLGIFFCQIDFGFQQP